MVGTFGEVHRVGPSTAEGALIGIHICWRVLISLAMGAHKFSKRQLKSKTDSRFSI